MTSQSPRIYTYKITFEEVPYYYYGVHKEKVFDEEYWGTPVTHKWCWELYTPKKQILEVFDYTDEGWLESQKIEKRLIEPFYQTSKWCLNKNCGGKISLEISRKNGKKVALNNKKNKKAIFSLSSEQILENASKGGKVGGKINAKNKTGVCGRSKEKMSEDGRKGGSVSGKINGRMNVEFSKGIFSLSEEEMKKYRSNGGKVGGKKQKELGIGIFSIPPEKVQERNKKNALQRWKCLETGFVTNAGNLTKYQKARGIDTSKRIRIL